MQKRRNNEKAKAKRGNIENSSEKLIFNIASITTFGAGDGTKFVNSESQLGRL